MKKELYFVRYSISKFMDFSGIFLNFLRTFQILSIFTKMLLRFFKWKFTKMPSDFQSQKFTKMSLQFLK